MRHRRLFLVTLVAAHFFLLISFKAPQNLKTVEGTKVEFDHHRVQTTIQAFYGWQSQVIF